MSEACRRVGEDTKLEEEFVCGVGKGPFCAVNRECLEPAGELVRIQNSRRILFVV